MDTEIQRMQIKLENICKIDQAILNYAPLRSIAGLAIEGLARLFPNDHISIALVDDPPQTASILAVRSNDKKPITDSEIVLPLNAFGDIEQLKQGKSQHLESPASGMIADALRDSQAPDEKNSYLIVPLLLRGDLIGTVNIGKNAGQEFWQEEIETLKEIGPHLAISICQSQLNEKSIHQRDELTTLLDVSNAIATTLDLDAVMQLTIEKSTSVMGLESGAIYLLQEDKLYLGATTPPLPPDFPEEFRIAMLEQHPHIGSSIASGLPVFLPDTRTAELTPQEKAISVERGLRSLLFVPLPVGSRIIGVLIMGTIGHTQDFTQDQINLCRTFSVQMALAVENARLHHETQLYAQELEKRVLERTRELEALTHSISHDLRAPLRAIQGFGQVLMEDHSQELSAEGHESLTRMISASEKLEGMFDGLLSLSQVGKREPVLEYLDLSEIAKKVLAESCRTNPGRLIEYTVNPCGSVCKSLLADRIYIEILLTNLVSNAFKFTKDKKPAVIEFGCYVDKGKGTYYLKDNGVGFDMAFASSIFLPFQRIHPEDEFTGFGIGMTIVKKIVELHNGRIWVESEIDKGTTVFFTLENLSKPG